MSPAIEVRDLAKTFGPTRALDRLDLTVEAGEVHGFLGPNGSGKSTTIRILLGLIRADSGTLRLLGEDPWKKAVALHRRIAYVPGEVNLWPNLSGGEAIELLGALRGGVDPVRRDELCDLFELDLRKKGSAYSRGNRQKVALVAALATEAEVFIFDEPTAGLDPLKEAVFQNCVREIRDSGRTVLLSSHILAQVEHLADHLTIIRGGRTIETGSLAEMRRLTRTTVKARTASSPEGIEAEDGVHDLRRDGNLLELTVDTASLGEVMSRLAEHGIISLVSQPPTLEDLFLREYEQEP